jgi:2-keto-4-pentenoate hydratase/2-oxohepta-3-ene-1,7-dioic acid hydratase in catechol pathway
MKLASVNLHGKQSWGVVSGDVFADLGEQLGGWLPDLKTVLVKNAIADLPGHIGGARTYPLSELVWLPVIPNPDKIFCVGLNYENHRQETERAEVAHPTVFARYANSQTGHLRPILMPKLSSSLDYEGELAVIIGKPGRYISRADAIHHVAGYACYNDVSVRDFQSHTHQFTPGKNFPDTGAFGPWLVTPNEAGDLAALTLQTRLNGAVVQETKLSEMIFDVARLIEYCSSFTRLEPGDVIATGTPGGVGAKRKPPLWMKPGDRIEVEITNIGLLINNIEDE